MCFFEMERKRRRLIKEKEVADVYERHTKSLQVFGLSLIYPETKKKKTSQKCWKKTRKQVKETRMTSETNWLEKLQPL